jgi:hypothetical protein
MNNINAADTNAALNDDLMSVELLANPTRKMDAISIVSSVVSSKRNKRSKDVEYMSSIGSDSSSGSASSSASSIASSRASATRSVKNKRNSPASSAKSDISDISNLSQLKKMSKAETINVKRELLYQFDRLEKKGVRVPKKFTMASELDEMRAEYERLKKDREVDVSVQFQRRALMAFVSGVEFLNNKFDPFEAKLEGWSENVNDNIHDFDDVFEDLYDKYKGKGTMAPELKLLMSLSGSAFMFHLTNTMFKSHLPGMQCDTGSGKSKRNKGGGGGGGGGGILSNMFGGLMGSLFNGGGGNKEDNSPRFDAARVNNNSMSGPDIDNIIDDIDIASILKNDRVEVTSTISESEISDMSSVKGGFGGLKKTKRSNRKTMNIM